MFALTFGNVEGYKIANGKDLLNPYVLADKYTFLLWSIAMYTDKVPSEERRFSDILKELVPDKDRADLHFTREQGEDLLRNFLSNRLLEAGLVCRTDDRGDPVVQLSPPLVAGEAEFDFIETTLRTCLSEAWKRMQG